MVQCCFELFFEFLRRSNNIAFGLLSSLCIAFLACPYLFCLGDGFLTIVQPTFEALLKLDIFRENVSLLFKMRTNMKDRKYNLGLPKQRQNRYLLGTDGVIADLPSGLSSGFFLNICN